MSTTPKGELMSAIAPPWNVQTALVTGAGGDIGRAICLRLAEHGVRIIAADYNKETGDETVDTLRSAGCDATFMYVNLADEESISGLAARAIESGPVHILVNNAGVTADALAEDISGSMWDWVMDVNLKGAFLLTRDLLEPMRAQGYGRIINMSSVVGVFGNKGQANYAASKSGLIAVTRTLAAEVGPDGLTANAVAPGYIVTQMTADVPERLKERFVRMTPVRRMGEPYEVARMVVFLADPESGYLNGGVYAVDGGLHL